MTWFYVDDQLSDHKKIARIPRPARTSAVGLWTLAGSWAKRHKTDGWVPGHMIAEFAGDEADAEALVAVKLWTRHKIDDEDGFVFVNWSKWQKTREQEEEAAARNAERQARYRKRRKGATEGQGDLFEDGNAVTNGVSNSVSNDVTPEKRGARPMTRRTGAQRSDLGERGVTPLLTGVVTTPPSSPSSPSSPNTKTEPTTSVPARAAADATPDADAVGDGSLPGMPQPPPRPDNRAPTQVLVGLWIEELCQDRRPPNRTIGHLSREVSVLLNRDGIPYDDVEAGLRRWHDLRLTPSQLANVVHEVRIADTPQASSYVRRPAGVNGQVRPAGRTTERLAALDALRDEPTRPREITQ